MPSRLLALTVDADDPARLAAFWSALLGREVEDGPRGPLLPGSATRVGLRFSPGGAPSIGLVALGARRSTTAGEGTVELLDPDGNDFCLSPAVAS